MDLNKVLLVGRVVRDIDLRMIPSGQSVASFSIATNRVWTDKAGQKQEQTEYHNIVVWGRQAELCNQYLTKGSTVLVEGRLQTRSWDSPQGEKKYRTEVVSERIQFGPRPGTQNQERMPMNGAAPSRQSAPSFPNVELPPEEELPEITQDQIPEDDNPPF